MGKILIVGSTGNVGRVLTARLAQAGETVRAATRNPENIDRQTRVEPVRFDFADSKTFAPALEGTDRVFVLAPPSPEPHKVVLPFLGEAVRNGRKVVLMTAVGVELSDAIPLRQVELALERSGATHVILRPNWFMDNFHTSWLPAIRQAGVISVPAADSRSAFIDVRDIAATAETVLRTNRFDGQAFTLTGPESLTYGEAAAILSQAAGRTVRYVPIDDAAFKRALLDAGLPPAQADYVVALFVAVRQNYAATVSTSVRDLTGRQPRTLAEYAKDHAELYSSRLATQ